MSYVIVFGNEKGGTGKSTLAMHAIVSLLKDGYTVSTIDIDGRQGTLSRYIENRQHAHRFNPMLEVPVHTRLLDQALPSLQNALDQGRNADFLIIDTPGSYTEISAKAHSIADILVTPLNDSFIDLDLLVHIEGEENTERLRPSTYANMVWEQRKKKMIDRKTSIEWFVVKNRLGHLMTKNKAHVDLVLRALSKRVGFHLLSGFGERVIFRELFLKGLTLLDLDTSETGLTFSHAAARQELRLLMKSLLSVVQKNKAA